MTNLTVLLTVLLIATLSCLGIAICALGYEISKICKRISSNTVEEKLDAILELLSCVESNTKKKKKLI